MLLAVVAVAAMLGACGRGRPGGQNLPSARYIVTTKPLDLGIGDSRFCVAVEPGNPRGAWWWEPGKDCSTRTTGPNIFPAEDAVVSSSSPGVMEITFRIQLIRRPDSPLPAYAEIVLTLADGQMQAVSTGSRVPTASRRDLDVPSAWQ